MNVRDTRSAHPLAGLRIGVLGKGGSGKSTMVALLARSLGRRGYEVVVLDADSTNLGLHQALGIADPPRPLLDYFGGSVFSGGAVTCPVDDPTELSTSTVDLTTLDERYARRNADGVWLLVAGKLAELGAGAGCDGPIAKITRDLEVRSGSAAPVLLVDLKAGFEDSARGVLVRLDQAVAVVDPTRVSVRMAGALIRLVDAIHAGDLPATRHLADEALVAVANRLYEQARIREVFVVLNKIAVDGTEAVLRAALAAEGVSVTSVVHEDPGLAQAWLLGEPLDGHTLDREVSRIVDAMETAVAGEAVPAPGRESGTATGEHRRHVLGPGGQCVCPACGMQIEHRRGVQCEAEHCPRCATKMLREGSRHHQLWLAKHEPVVTSQGRMEAKP